MKVLLLPLCIFGNFILSNLNVPIKAKLAEKQRSISACLLFIIGFGPVGLVHRRIKQAAVFIRKMNIPDQLPAIPMTSVRSGRSSLSRSN